MAICVCVSLSPSLCVCVSLSMCLYVSVLRPYESIHPLRCNVAISDSDSLLCPHLHQCDALGHLGVALTQVGRHSDGLKRCAEHLVLAEQLDTRRNSAVIEFLAEHDRREGQTQAVLARLQELIALAGDGKGKARAYRKMSALIAETQDEGGGVQQLHTEHLVLAQDAEDELELSIAHGTGAVAFFLRGDVESAKRAMHHRDLQEQLVRKICKQRRDFAARIRADINRKMKELEAEEVPGTRPAALAVSV